MWPLLNMETTMPILVRYLSKLECFISIICVGLFMLFMYISRHETKENFPKSTYWFMDDHVDVHANCMIPQLDPFDRKAMELYYRPEPLQCGHLPKFISIKENGTINVNFSVEGLSCVYNLLIRVNDNNITFGKALPFNGTSSVSGDFFRLRCQKGTTLLYDNLHFQIQQKLKHSFLDETDEQLSVIIFAIDSVSQMSALRKLPKTMKFIKRDLGGYIFTGYTKVGPNTLPNIVPLLTGKSVEELPKMDYRREYFDHTYPFIWKSFSKKGYPFLFGEDFPSLSMFNFNKKGFKYPPADHYMRPFFLAAAKVNTSINNVNSDLCYGGQPIYENVVNYVKQFMDAFKNKRRLSFSFITELAHNHINLLDHGDESFVKFLKYLKYNRHLDKTVVFFLSDHGTRVETHIRNSPSGRIEGRMPLLSVIVPEYLKNRYPNLHKNLLHNSNRVLTTPYDVFETLKSILNRKFDNKRKHSPTVKQPRGVSLFEPIPKNRTCADAGVPGIFCPCYLSSPINASLSFVREICERVVLDVNSLLRNHWTRCERLSLKTVIGAWKVSSGLLRDKYKEIWINTKLRFSLKGEEDSTKKYMVACQTYPGDGVFEAFVHFRPGFWGSSINVIGEIVRANRYGNQSSCVIDNDLKNYCYCK